MEVKQLEVKIGANKKEYEQAMKGISKSIQNHKEQFRKAGRAMTMAGAAVVGSLGLLVKGYVKAGDEVHKMSLRTGLSTEALSELKYACEISGTSLATLEKGVKKMASSIGEAKLGLKTYTDAFKLIGMEVQELDGLNPEEQFMKMAAGIAAIEGPTQRAYAAQKLLGRAGTELLPLFSAGAEGMEKLRQKAREMGLSISGPAAEGAAKLGDAMTTLKGTLQGAGRQIAEALVPTITALAEKVSDIVTRVKDWIQAHPALTGWIVKLVAGAGALMMVLGPIAMVLPGLVQMFGLLKIKLIATKAATLAVAVANKILGTSFTVALGPVGLIVAAIAGLIAIGYLVVKNWGKIKDALAGIWRSIKEVVVKVFNSIKGFVIDSLMWILDKVSKIPLAGKFAKGWKESLASIRAEMRETAGAVKEESEGMSKALEGGVAGSKIMAKFTGLLGLSLDDLKQKMPEVSEETKGLGKAFEETKEKQKTWIDYMKSVGLMTISAKQARIKELEGFLRGLEGAYKDNKITLEDYTKAVKAAKDEIWDLAEVVETTLPPARNMAGVLDLATEAMGKVAFVGMTAKEQMKKFAIDTGWSVDKIKMKFYELVRAMMALSGINLPKITFDWSKAWPQLKEGIEEVKTDWGQVAKDISKTWGTGLGEMLAKTKTFGDLMKNTFAMLGSAVGTEISGMVGNLLSSLGAMAGPIGAIVGGIASSLVSMIGGLFGGKTEAEKEAERKLKEQKSLEAQIKQITKDFEHLGTISESTAKKIQEAAQEMDYWKAVALSFNDIIKDVGVTQENVNDLWDQATIYILRYSNGLLSATEASDILDDAFKQLLDGTKKLGEEGSAAMVEFIITAREAGLEIASVTEYVLGQLSRIPDAMSTLIDRFTQGWKVAAGEIENINGRIEDATTRLQDLLAEQAEVELGSDEWHELEKAIQDTRDEIAGYEASLAHWSAEQDKFIARSTDDVERLAMTTFASFNAMRDSGMSFGDAITEMQDPLAQLAQLYEDFGLAVPEYLESLFKIAGVREEYKQLYDETEALTVIMDALRNSGIRNAEVFQGMTVDARQLFRQYQKAGLSQEESLWSMQDLLQSIYNSSQLYGYELDRNTQRIINQAIAMGIVEEEQQSATEVMKEGFDGMIQGMKDGIEKLGKVIYYVMTGDFEAAREAMEEGAEDTAIVIGEEFGEAAQGIGHSFTNCLDGVDMGKPFFDNSDLNIKRIRDEFEGALDGVNMRKPKFEAEPGGKSIRGAQKGVDEYISEPQLYLAHPGERVKIGKPSAFRGLTRLEGGGDIYLTAKFEINAVDERSIRDIVRKKIGPEFIQYVKVGLGKTLLREALG